MKKVLTSPSSFGQISTEPFNLLKQNGFSPINNPHGRKLKENEIIELGNDCVAVIAGVENFSKNVLDSLPKLKCISRVGVGLDSIDLDYAEKKGIKILNTPDGPTRSVAEFTLAMALSLLRKIPQAHNDMKNNIWKKQVGNLFAHKTVGIIGLGRIGKNVAELFNATGFNVIGFDINPDHLWAKKNSVKLESFNKVVSMADILTLHVPGNTNKPLIKKIDFIKMKKESVLINLSRGGVVDESALFNALKNNEIKGAATDVYEEEPYSGDLNKLDNIILTPHIGSYTMEGKLKMEIDAVNNMLKYFNKKI